MVLTLIICAFAACGVLLVGRAALDALRMPVRREDAVFVVCLRGNAAQVEQTVRACLRLRQRRPEFETLLFIDRGIDPEGQRVARLALRNETNAALCSAQQIPEFISWEK